MFTLAKRAGVVALTVAVLWTATVSSVQAQQRFLPVRSYYPYNQNSYLFPGLPARVYNPNINTPLISRYPYSSYPGGGFGGGVILGGGGYYGGSPFGINANLSNPGYGNANVGAYSFALGNGGYYPGYTNPFYSSASYSPTYGSGYTPTYSSPGNYGGGYGYYTSPYSNYLYGTADVMRAYGQLGLTSEQARILREVATQAQLDTDKKRLDTLNYLRANTPTYTDKQKKIALQELDRIQNLATPSEIWSGNALNVLLKDLIQKSLSKPLKLHPLPLNEKLMSHINVTAKKGFGNIGLLRNDGRFEWPVALQEIASAEEQKNMTADAQEAYRRAAANRPFANFVDDLSRDVAGLRERLLKRANDLPTDQYLAAKRFLNNFDDALAAIKGGDVRRNIDFHKEFSGEGKTIQDLVDYMGKNGLRFAPAVNGDEDAYQALHSLLAAYSLAASANLASSMHGVKDLDR